MKDCLEGRIDSKGVSATFIEAQDYCFHEQLCPYESNNKYIFISGSNTNKENGLL